MKMIILVIGFILEIVLVSSDFTLEWTSARKVCCEQAYKDNVSLNKCVSEIEKEMKDSLVEYNLKLKSNRKENEARKELIIKLVDLPENKKRYKGLKSTEEIMSVTNAVVAENKAKIDTEVDEARKKEFEEFKGKFKTMCQVVATNIAKENDPNTFTIEVFALIVASGAKQFNNEDCSKFIKYLKDNKDDLEKLKEIHADLWQRLFYVDKNVVTVINSCNCKETILTEGFHKFLKWVFQQKQVGEVKLCPLRKAVEVYKQHKTVINKDPDIIKTILIEKMKNCR